jgi:hypothetical protein
MQGARKKRTADSSDQIAGGEEGRKLNAETLRAQRRTKEEFTQRARRKSTARNGCATGGEDRDCFYQ